MKVNRQNLTEEYKTTAGWVRDFSGGLSKQADYLENLKSMMKKRKDFDTIEEKMADLRSRVGFDLVKSIGESDPENVKEASDCGCNSCDACSIEPELSDKDKEAIKSLKVILKYIADFSKDRPDAGYGAIMNHCREHPGLGLDRLESRLNDSFKKTVQSIISSHKKKDPEAVEYISGENIISSNDDDMAEYYHRAATG